MKKFVFFIIVLAGVYGCSKDETGGDVPSRLVSPELYAAVNTTSPFTGVLEVYPCKEGTSVYTGNYKNGALNSMYPNYQVKDGLSVNSPTPVLLPVGDYSMVYWGVPTATEPTYQGMADNSPAILIGMNLADTYRSLRARTYGEDIYLPVFDYVFAVQKVQVGTDKLAATLNRAVAAINVVVKNKDNSPFGTQVSGMWVTVGNIAQRISYYTALPENQTKTVRFELTPNSDQTQYISKMVNLFPSAANPPLELFIELANGTVKSFAQNLSTTLSAGSRLTLTLSLEGLMSEENQTGSFSVSDWIEQSENIDIPVLKSE